MDVEKIARTAYWILGSVGWGLADASLFVMVYQFFRSK